MLLVLVCAFVVVVQLLMHSICFCFPSNSFFGILWHRLRIDQDDLISIVVLLEHFLNILFHIFLVVLLA